MEGLEILECTALVLEQMKLWKKPEDGYQVSTDMAG